MTSTEAASQRRDAAEALARVVAAELGQAAPPRVLALARQLAARGGDGVAAIVFYGSALRDETLDGVLDFYVLTDAPGDWPGPRLAALAGRLLPPNVGWFAQDDGALGLRAKYAVMTLRQFASAMSARRIDTTLWARFSQPCACVFVRSEADALALRQAVVDAVVTAARWAAVLGPARGEALAFWRALYQRTYQAELRVERSGRGADLVGRDAQRYARLLPLAWRVAGIGFDESEGGSDGAVLRCFEPRFDERARLQAARRWQRREKLGRPLNLLRLLKAALTFDNAIDYVAWKVHRHSGYRIEPSDFQRRHPLLAAPALYWRLRSLKVLR